jgi:hypothetical protein
MNAYTSSFGQLPSPRPSRKGYWKRFGGKFFIVSILAHILFAMGAAYLVIRILPLPKKEFQPVMLVTNPAIQTDRQKVQVSKVVNSAGAPAIPRRIASISAANVTIPDVPDTQSMDAVKITPMIGMSGPGYTVSTTGPSIGTTGIYTSPYYGTTEVIPDGLKGTFYDLKFTNGRKDSGMTYGKYAEVVTQFVKNNWNESLLSKYLKGTRPLYATRIFFPEIESTEAPKAFNSPVPESSGMWVAVYKGVVSPLESGTYHFVGAGDDDMIVRFDGRLVLDKCEHIDPQIQSLGTFHYAGLRNEFARGLPITVEAGKFYNVEILIGDHIPTKTMAVLLIEKEGVNYEKEGDAPILPPFALAADKSQPALSPDALPAHVENGPLWKGKATTSLLDQ